MVYMADSISLAVLENLVHLNREDFPVGYVVFACRPSSCRRSITICSTPNTRTLRRLWWSCRFPLPSMSACFVARLYKIVARNEDLVVVPMKEPPRFFV